MKLNGLFLARSCIAMCAILGIPLVWMNSTFAENNIPVINFANNVTGFAVNHTSSPEPELPTGVPFIVHVSYQNGSFLSSGPFNYLIKFDFSEPFVITDIIRGSFENATIVGNDTVKFYGNPISKGENKTGVVLFNFNNGLAEKHRNALVTTNVTLHGLNEIVRNLDINQPTPPIFANLSGTFANTELFTNESLFSTATGTMSEIVSPSLINDIPINLLRDNLDNLTLPQIAGTFNALSPSRADELIRSLPPLAPSKTISTSSSFMVNSSIVDLASIIVNLTNDTFSLASNIYGETTPCLSLEKIESVREESRNFDGISLLTFLIAIKNCSVHPELISMKSHSTPDFERFFDISRFDLVSNDTKQLRFITVVPSITVPGFYKIFVVADAVYNVIGHDIVVTKTEGMVHFIVQ